ncbi:MAG: MBL fold metallo-hydrolase [Candidatus Hydrogenedentes bacterium]|nr:MBL fold metallo-hydrolase [Candidatus Hydrogenedentota bacterium]
MAKIEWLGHASFRISDGATIYIDPWKLSGDNPKADLILVSHSHFDHLSVEDIEKIRSAETTIICSKDCVEQLDGNVIGVGSAETHEVGGVTVRTVPAYNPAKEFHPQENDWLGFLVTVGGETIYYAGDTDATPAMGDLGKVDVALLPVGGTYTMDAEQAAQAAATINPGQCIPYHWGDIIGTREDAKQFEKLCGCPTKIL